MLVRIVFLVSIAILITIVTYGFINSDSIFIGIGILLAIAALLMKSMMKIKIFYK